MTNAEWMAAHDVMALAVAIEGADWCCECCAYARARECDESEPCVDGITKWLGLERESNE